MASSNMANHLVLLAGASFVTAAIMFLSEVTQPTLEHSALSTCTRWQQAHVQQLLSEAEGAKAQAGPQKPAAAAAQAGSGGKAAVAAVAADALRRAGWRSGVKFAKFGETWIMCSHTGSCKRSVCMPATPREAQH